MSETERRIRRPDGWSASIPLFPTPFGIGATYYSNPGSPSSPRVTVTGSLGVGGGGINSVFLRRGMTSRDTLGYGASGTVSTFFPSVTVNASIPDENYIPQPWKAKVCSIEAGIGLNGFSGGYTWTPEQIADFLTKYSLVGAPIVGPTLGPVTPAMGPDDELSPFARTLRSGHGTVSTPSEAPVRYLSRRQQDPLGDGTGDWRLSTTPVEPWRPTQPAVSPQEPSGLYGLILDYLRDH